jgi:hypothetical protein
VRKLVVLAVACLAASEAEAQQHESVRRAQAAYNDLDYAGAIAAARESLTEQLSRDERVSMYELLGFSYGALDSTSEAVAAFRRLIFLDPDREPDIERVSPRITSLYASALGQVLVVRRVRVDSATFVAGQGSVPVHFEVTRLARTRTRAVGQGLDMVVDSQLVAGGASARFDWPVLDRSGTPLPEGEYQLVTTAIEEGQSEFSSSPQVVRVRHAMRDTLPALTSLPGYERQPEMVTPPRDWRPMLMSVLYTGIGAGAFLATENGHLGRGPRTALFSVSGLMIATGLAVSLRKPDARPSRPNILYNQLLGELLSKRNADIARENSVRRRQILITVVGVR